VALAAPPAPERATSATAGERAVGPGRQRAGDLLVGATLLVWATWLTAGTGGREPHRLSVVAVLVLASALVVPPWRVLPRTALVLGHGLGLAAFGVVAIAPTGWEGADAAASYAVLGQLVMVLLAWAVDPLRRQLLLLSLLLFGALQLPLGWLSYWGGGDPARPFQGTFYWHNQVGVALAVGAVLGVWAVNALDRPWRLLAWFGGPLAGAGCLLTTSRASVGLMGLGVVSLAALALARRRWLDLARVASGAAAIWVVSLGLVSPFFFPDAGGASPLDGADARGEAEPLQGNTAYRLVTWRLAVDVFREWPLTGTGFHGFKSAASQVSGEPQIVHHSHNGFLQAAADGGLLLALPFWSGALLVAFVLLRRLAATRLADAGAVGSGLALGVLVLHGGMDFDWSYPALLLALGVALAAGVAQPGAPAAAGARSAAVPQALLCASLLVLAAAGAWGGGLDLNTSVGGAL
jgi:O-antigen ligase